MQFQHAATAWLRRPTGFSADAIILFLLIRKRAKASAIKNDSAEAATGAGTACAQALFNHGVKAVISGKVGPNAYEVLKAAGVTMYSAPPGLSVQEALEKFKAGSLPKNEVRRF